MLHARRTFRIVLTAALVGAALLGGVASAEDPPRAPDGDAAALPAPEAPPEKPGRDVVLVTDDGMRIAATAWASGGAANGPGVVLLHMYRHERSTWAPLVPYLLERGVAVIAIDLRGHGGSAKQGQEDLSQRVEKRDAKVFAEMHRDAMAAVTWLVAEGKCDPKRIALVGASVGCSVAIDTARRHPGATAAVVCMTAGASYLGLDSLERAKASAGEPLLLLTHAEEADVGSRALHAAVAGSRLVIYDEKPSGDAKDQEGWAHGTRMFGRMALVERTVASFVAARTGSKVDDVVLDGVVDAEGAPGADPWAKAVDVAGAGGGGKAWAYRVGRRIAFGGIVPAGCAQVRVWAETGATRVRLTSPPMDVDAIGSVTLAAVDVAAGRVVWRLPEGGFLPVVHSADGPVRTPLVRPPGVRVVRSAAGATFEGEWYAPSVPQGSGGGSGVRLCVLFDRDLAAVPTTVTMPDGLRELPSR